jgi:predicted MPP superfamily phosphohydrolase
MILVLILLALVGHGFLWAAFFNYTHSAGMPRRLMNRLTSAGFACAVLIPLAFGGWLVRGGLATVGDQKASPLVWAACAYVGACWIAGTVAMVRWARRRVFHRPPQVLRHNRTRSFDLRRPSGPPASKDHRHHVAARLPGNQVLRLDLAERAFEVPRLAAALDRLTIVHLSDLHFCGRIGKGYFREVVRRCNEWEPDLVAITGDLVDHPRYVDWLPDTLGELTSRHGTYFILGNHDLRVNTDRLRQALVDLGLVDLGGRWTEIEIGGEPVILAGNELPWFGPAADLEQAPPPSLEGGLLRIALAHSPDQLRWAQANGIDLLLAGHTHGGQIRLPLVGPILSATRLGANYSSGLFHAPPAVMHVTRGVSGHIPVRIHCPPELAKLVLRVAS